MSDLKEIKVNVNTNNDEVTVRAGEAEPVVPFRKALTLSGNIDIAFRYLKNAPTWFSFIGKDHSYSDSPLQYSELIVNREKGTIDLIVDRGNPWESKYNGALVMSDIFELFGVNSGKSYTTFELADLIKMNRSYLETTDRAMVLVSVLRNFKATVDKQVELSDDARGNKRALIGQIVDSNIPEAFKLNLPIFKGFDPIEFEVEININAGDLSCTLISPSVNDYINENKSDLIDAQLAAIFEIYPTLKVFEV